MRKSAVVKLAVVAALVLGACGSDDEGGTADGGPGDPTSADVGKAPGVTAKSIKIGINYVDLEAIRDMIDLDHGDYEATYQALIDDINDRGGINGRTLDPVFVKVNPLGDESAAASCAQLTEEDKVFVTVGLLLEDTVLCHVEEHDSAVIGGSMTPERLAKAKAPWFTTEASVDLQTEAIREMNEAGVFDGKLAVFSIGPDEALLRDQIEPALEEFGIVPVDVAVLEGDAEDLAASNASTQRIAAQFEASGATKVLVVGQGAINWANGLELTSYRPQSLFTSGIVISTWLNDAASHDLSVLEGSMIADIYGGRVNQYREPNMQLCLGALSEHGIDIPEPTDSPVPPGTPDPFTSALTACKQMTLLEGLLTNVEGDLGYDSFRAAADRMGDLPMPASDRPYRYGAPPQADGDAPVSLFDYVPGTNSYARRNT